MISMKITLLGTGTCVPRLDRSACAVLIETGASKILLDLGPGTMRRLLECGVPIFDLTHIFLSHFHPDHSAELVPLIFSTKYPDHEKRKKPLTLLAGQGLIEFYLRLQTAYGDNISLPLEQMAIHEIDTQNGNAIYFDDFKLSACPTRHSTESLAIRIENDSGHTVVYSGDTDECDNLVDLAQHADLFICESAMPDELKIPGHLTPSLAGRMAQKAGVKRLVLTHLYPQCDEVDIVKQAGNAYKGKIFAAEDMMTFRF